MEVESRQSFLENERVCFVPLERICPNPAQPRKVFEQDGLLELAASIRSYGVLQPVSVRRRGEGFELVAGERRLRAARLAGLKEIPCVVLGVDESQSSMIALVENLQRRDLDFIEEAEGIARLMRLYSLSQEQVARRLGKSQSAIANKLRILRHSPRILKSLRSAGLSERHARALLKLPTEEERYALLQQVISRGLTVAKTEQLIEAQLAKKPTEKKLQRTYLMRDVRFFLNSLSHNLEIVRSAGIDADASRTETENEIVLTIRIPKRAG